MPLPRHLFAPAFRHQRLGWFFALLIGIMVYLATLAMGVGATLSAITITWDSRMQSRLTVEIPAADDESATPPAERLRQSLALLQAMPEVARVLPLSDDDVARLLQPWIEAPELLKSLPLPILIDVERQPGSTLDAATLQSRLKPIAASIRVDDQAAWLADIEATLRGLILLAGLTLFLAALALVVIVSLICRAVMATERETVSLLHAMGAADSDIARHFQFLAQCLSWPGALGGFALAVISAAGVLLALRHIADPAELATAHWAALGFSVFCVPVMAVIIASLAARLATLKLLRALP